MNKIVTIDLTWLSIVAGTILPMLVALITNRMAESWVKAVVLILLSVVAGWLTELQANGGSFELGRTAVHVLATFAVAILAHFGALKPLRVTGSGGVIARAVPGGLGPVVAPSVV